MTNDRSAGSGIEDRHGYASAVRLSVPGIASVVAVGLLAAASVYVLFDSNYSYPQYHRANAYAVLLALLATVPLLLVRRYPALILVITSIAVLISMNAGYSRWVAAGGPALAAGISLSSGALGRRLAPLAAAAIVVWVALRADPAIDGALLATAIYIGLAALVGLLIRAGTARFPSRAG